MTDTSCCLFNKSVSLANPYFSIFLKRMEWLIVSKHFFMSKEQTSVAHRQYYNTSHQAPYAVLFGYYGLHDKLTGLFNKCITMFNFSFNNLSDMAYYTNWTIISFIIDITLPLYIGVTLDNFQSFCKFCNNRR